MLQTTVKIEIIIFNHCLSMYKSKYNINFNSEQIFQSAKLKFIPARYHFDRKTVNES